MSRRRNPHALRSSGSDRRPLPVSRAGFKIAMHRTARRGRGATHRATQGRVVFRNRPQAVPPDRAAARSRDVHERSGTSRMDLNRSRQEVCMQGEFAVLWRRAALACMLSLCVSVPAAAHGPALVDPAMVDSAGKSRSERAQWVYRIVAKWGGHVQEAYRADPRQWARAMHEVFLRVPVPTLRAAADARSFSAMNDVLLASTASSGLAPQIAARPADLGAKALGDPAQDLVYVPVTPCRILDTRVAGGPIAANTVRDFDLADATSYAIQGGDNSDCGVGNKGSFAAAALNITVVQPSSPGYITVYPHQANRPLAGTANYAAGEIRNNLAIVRLDQTSATYEFSVYSFSQAHLVVDIVGYFTQAIVSPMECVDLASNPVGIDRLKLVRSPACPSGYNLIGGDCKTLQYNQYGPAYIASSYVDQDVYVCAWYGQNTGAISIARCCR